MKSWMLALCIGILLIPMNAFSQVLACSTIQGTWIWAYDGTHWMLSQDNKGNISGYLMNQYCTGNQQWPITGTLNSAQFTFTATNAGCTNSSATSLTLTGSVGEPGCNYIYGNWTNSLGHSGGFGDSNPYPTVSDYFTKAVDVPTSESTAVPTGAQWDTSHGAPWIQTFAPNTPPGEFEARGVYEYATGQGTDTCWFKGSSVAIFNAITTPGFGWTVSSQNTWGTDFIGWNLAAVRYYRNKKRAPCSSSFQQQLVIDAAYSPSNPSSYTGPFTDNSGNTFYGVPYETNTLGASITGTTATSVRNDQTSTNTTWK